MKSGSDPHRLERSIGFFLITNGISSAISALVPREERPTHLATLDGRLVSIGDIEPRPVLLVLDQKKNAS